MRINLDWQPYFDIAEQDLPYREKVSEYAAIAREHFQTEAFEAFCEQHLPHLDQVTWDYFGTDRAKEAVRKKVVALFPEHEWDEFTEHFWEEIQNWRDSEHSGHESTSR
jgi:hypothetical protein